MHNSHHSVDVPPVNSAEAVDQAMQMLWCCMVTRKLVMQAHQYVVPWRNSICPSQAPSMLPCVYVKHPAVTQFVVGGADLMLPGEGVSRCDVKRALPHAELIHVQGMQVLQLSEIDSDGSFTWHLGDQPKDEL
jgi:hypothetical protein